MFTTNYVDILKLIDNIDPVKYGKTRNYGNGAVTKLSPYISRGVISTRQIAKAILNKGYKPYEILIFLKELAWRDYFQQTWIHFKEKINEDIKQPQTPVSNHGTPENIVLANTGITAIDTSIENLYETGYMHNHMRMYVASVCCNIGKSHWLNPAKWMYYHLLDADWASNALSWQWVAGSFSSKKYFANQENINKYFFSDQTNSFLDKEYEELYQPEIPEQLINTSIFKAQTNLPPTEYLNIDAHLPVYIYNFYNLDPGWDKHVKANRVFLLEPSFFKKFAVSDNTMNFLLKLSKNISGIKLFVGEFDELIKNYPDNAIHYKEHPTNQHYKGIEHERDWMFSEVTGYYPSFFNYWKKCEKYLKNL